MNSTPATPCVYLIGAGPGAADLLTLRGAECLRRADIILYDYLANPAILAHARPDAECVCLGKHGRSAIWPQEEINRRLVNEARQGKIVARLKGGDPVVFARVAEELAALHEARIPFEIVPGITAAAAAGSYAGIPITHGERASAVAFVTGQEKPGKREPAVDYEPLARFPGTLVIYMGVTTVSTWTAALLRAGKPPETPCAIVRRVSLPDQEVIRCRLDEVADALTPSTKLRPPVLTIIGPVAELAATYSWFERRPLHGQSVLITRPRHQADALAGKLAEWGAETLFQPAIEIDAVADPAPLDACLSRLNDFDWLVFSSSNGVQYFLDRLLRRGDLRQLGGIRLAAVGPGTADALAAYRLSADLVPPEYRAESLAAALVERAAGQRFLLLRASRGREVLAEQLRAAGSHVEQVVVYESRDASRPDPVVADRLRRGQLDWATVTSSAIARNLAALFGAELRLTKLASISPVTSATLEELGFPPTVEAREYTMDGVVEAILAHAGGDSAEA